VLLLAAGFTAYRSGALGTLAPGSTSSAAGPNRPVITDPSASDLEDFVRDYYGLLPDQPAEAWSMLGTQARAASDGFASYRRFYGSISAVSFATDPTAVDGKTVRASLRFVPKSGSVSVERYQFTVVPGADGKLVMTAFTRDAR
jgi:hypothetical protein